jgi:hypothetical protein
MRKTFADGAKGRQAHHHVAKLSEVNYQYVAGIELQAYLLWV